MAPKMAQLRIRPAKMSRAFFQPYSSRRYVARGAKANESKL